jgi:hypothetical protein
VPFDRELRGQVEALAQQMHELFRNGETPPQS